MSADVVMPENKFAWADVERDDPPKRTAVDRVADFLEVYSDFDEQTAREQASRCLQCPNPSCSAGCPLSNRIPEWLALTAEGRFLEAAEISQATSNMPEICSRICPQDRLCEGSCILNGRAEPVSIGAIEKFLNEYAFRHRTVNTATAPPNGHSVAIVGSGPAGMACADELAKRGYAVTIFESMLIPGGLLVNGIPAFKLEKDVVERRLEVLKKRGVELRLGVTIGKDLDLGDLLAKFDAVFLGIGAQQAKALDVPGADLNGIHQALPFLIQKNVDFEFAFADIDVKGKRVAVLGGGDTAMDCLRTSLRCGASEVACLYRRDLENMPGSRKEFFNALEEGARFHFLINPIAVLGAASGNVTHIRCVRMKLGEPDAAGRRKPHPIPGSEFDHPADIILVAYGFDQVPFPPGSDLSKLTLNKWGGVVVDANQMSSRPGVFAGGDLVRGASLAVEAVRDARKAVKAIDAYVKSKHSPPGI